MFKRLWYKIVDMISYFKKKRIARSHQCEATKMVSASLTSSEKYKITNWGDKKKRRFNHLVLSGNSLVDSYRAVEFNNGEIDV